MPQTHSPTRIPTRHELAVVKWHRRAKRIKGEMNTRLSSANIRGNAKTKGTKCRIGQGYHVKNEKGVWGERQKTKTQGSPLVIEP